VVALPLEYSERGFLQTRTGALSPRAESTDTLG